MGPVTEAAAAQLIGDAAVARNSVDEMRRPGSQTLETGNYRVGAINTWRQHKSQVSGKPFISGALVRAS